MACSRGCVRVSVKKRASSLRSGTTYEVSKGVGELLAERWQNRRLDCIKDLLFADAIGRYAV